MRRLFACAALSAALISSAQGDVIKLGPVDLTGQGLGTTDSLLTLPTTQTGSDSRLVINPPEPKNRPDSSITIEGIGLSFQRSADKTTQTGSLSDSRVVVNPPEPKNKPDSSITIERIGLSFQSSADKTTQTGLLSDSRLFFNPPEPKNADFLVGLDAQQLLDLALIPQGAGNISDVTLGISPLLLRGAGGPEIFSAVSQVPLPPAAVLFLSALIGLGLLSRRRWTHS